jgi:hypothetical protein
MGKGASLGKEAVLADSGRVGGVAAQGQAGEKSDFFSILLVIPRPRAYSQTRHAAADP